MYFRGGISCGTLTTFVLRETWLGDRFTEGRGVKREIGECQLLKMLLLWWLLKNKVRWLGVCASNVVERWTKRCRSHWGRHVAPCTFCWNYPTNSSMFWNSSAKIGNVVGIWLVVISSRGHSPFRWKIDPWINPLISRNHPFAHDNVKEWKPIPLRRWY